MDTRKRNEYIIIALLVIGLAVLVWFLLQKKTPESVSPTDPDVVRSMPTAQETFTPEQLAQGKQAPDVVARSFTERFSSYSNESGFGNVEDVLPLVTADMRARLEALRVAAQAELTENYYGVNTRIVSLNEVERGENTVKYEIQTQREEQIGGPDNSQVRYQKLTVAVAQVDGVWLVSDYAWEN